MAEPIVPTCLDAGHDDVYDRTHFGFWLYLMTDCVLFATLFATYAVLHKNTFGGVSSHDIFDLNDALIETFFLLASSFTSGMAMMVSQDHNRKKVLAWLGLTFLLGLGFIFMEVREFHHFVLAGHKWDKSAFLSSFYTLVGTHGLHVSSGLLWLGVLMWQIGTRGMTSHTIRRFTCFRMFWHFLDVVWIFIFTIVYLMGVI